MNFFPRRSRIASGRLCFALFAVSGSEGLAEALEFGMELRLEMCSYRFRVDDAVFVLWTSQLTAVLTRCW